MKHTQLQALAALAMLAALHGNARAELVFNQFSLDLGRLRTGQMLEHKFTYTNKGPKPVEIVEAKASCGCLNPALDRRILQVGDSGNLTLHIHTLSAPPGNHTWRVTLQYKIDGAVHETMLAIIANVVQEIVVQPPALMIYAEGPVKHELTVTDVRPQTFKVGKVAGSSPHLKAELTSEQPDAVGHVVRKIAIQIGAGFATGRHEELVSIYTDDPTYAELRIPVVIVKKERVRYSVSPGEVSLVASASLPQPSRIVVVRDTQGQPVVIDKVLVDDPAISCQWAQGPNAVGTVKITVDQAKLKGEKLESKVHVYLGEGGAETVSVPVVCTKR